MPNPKSRFAIIFDCFGVLYGDSFEQPVADIIQSLRPKYKTGLLSNAERRFLDDFLAENNAAHLFDVVLGSSETAFAKPQRGIFEEIARRLGVELPEIIFVDDSAANIAAAAHYGITAIHYQNPTQLRRELSARLGPN